MGFTADYKNIYTYTQHIYLMNESGIITDINTYFHVASPWQRSINITLIDPLFSPCERTFK